MASMIEFRTTVFPCLTELRNKLGKSIALQIDYLQVVCWYPEISLINFVEQL